MHPTEEQEDAMHEDSRNEARPAGPDDAEHRGQHQASPETGGSSSAHVPERTAPVGAALPGSAPNDRLFDTHPETPQSISSHPPGTREAEQLGLGQLPPVGEVRVTGKPPFDEGSSDSVVADLPAPTEPPPASRRSFPPVPDSQRPSYVFLGVVAALALFADISTKVWAEIVINARGFEPIAIIGDNVNITLAYNRGGAWGLFASAEKMVRLPFFLSVSVFAIFFIVSLYARLHPSQRALKWGLPMVLGGALGNLSDRITRSQVIDFIDYRAKWVMDLNIFINRYVSDWTVTDHWPTFNVADIAICIGVILMGVDMFSHRHRSRHAAPPSSPGAPSGTDRSESSSSESPATTLT